MNLANVTVIQDQDSEEETRKDSIAEKGDFSDKGVNRYRSKVMQQKTLSQ